MGPSWSLTFNSRQLDSWRRLSQPGPCPRRLLLSIELSSILPRLRNLTGTRNYVSKSPRCSGPPLVTRLAVPASTLASWTACWFRGVSQADLGCTPVLDSWPLEVSLLVQQKHQQNLSFLFCLGLWKAAVSHSLWKHSVWGSNGCLLSTHCVPGTLGALHVSAH